MRQRKVVFLGTCQSFCLSWVYRLHLALDNGDSVSFVDRSMPIRLTQTPTRYRKPHRTEGKSTRKQFLVSDGLISDYAEDRGTIQFTSHFGHQGHTDDDPAKND